MRILFLSDLHGRILRLDGVTADLIVAGGDYCAVDEIRQLKFAALERGLHPLSWPELVGRARAEELLDAALERGSAVLAALAASGLPILAIPGNSDRVGDFGRHLLDRHDPRPDQPVVEGRMWNLEGRVLVRAGIAFAGLGGWSGPHDPERQDREQQAIADQHDGRHPLILVSHNVPHGSLLDGVDNPEVPDFVQGRMVGSQRCRAVIESARPVLCLCGHLHEKYGRTQIIDGTLCINGAGGYRGAGVLIEVTRDGRLGEPRFIDGLAA